jgi:L-threonylcarbamoyladenylate synthase
VAGQRGFRPSNYGILGKKKPIISNMSKTEILRLNAEQPEPGPIFRAAEALRRGGLVAFPTETVYGLGANALDGHAVQKIFEAKGRPAASPIIVHAATAESARELAAEWPDVAQRLAEVFWPGSLTLVVPRRLVIPSAVTGGGTTVGLRVPAHPVALALINAAGLPVAAPSANRSNRLSPTLAKHVLQDLDGRIDLILDAGPAWGGLESTVLDVSVSPPLLLRPGLVTPREIEAIIGPIIQEYPRTNETAVVLPFRSPGLLPRHYAPRAPLECISGTASKHVAQLVAAGVRVGWLCFGVPNDTPGIGIEYEAMPTEPRPYGAKLYDVLHKLDAAAVDRIIVELPPETDEWLAVRDRLHRAARE